MSKIIKGGYNDRDAEGNSERHRNGKTCIGIPLGYDCRNEAGTGWSHLWCFACNVKRMDSIGASLDSIAEKATPDNPVGYGR